MRRAAILTMVFLLLPALPRARAELKPKKVPGWTGVSALKLFHSETEFLMLAARAMLEAETTVLKNAGVKDRSMPKVLAKEDGRWVFLSFFATQRKSRTYSGHGRAIIDSLANAVESALADKAYREDFAPRLKETRIQIDLPIWVEPLWPLNRERMAAKFDPAAYGMYVSMGNKHGYMLPVHYFSRALGSEKFVEEFFAKFDIKSEDLTAKGGSAFMVTLNSHVEAEPGGIPVPLVRGNLLRAGVSADVVDTRVRMAARYLADRQDMRGAFFSSVDPRVGERRMEGYDAARHAEATIALLELSAKARDKTLELVCKRAVEYLIGQCRMGRQGDRRFFYLVDRNDKADMGATATAAVALALDAALTSSHKNDAIIERLLEFLVMMQTFEGDFRDRWPVPERASGDITLASPRMGQALCALAEGARRFPANKAYAKALDRSAGALLARPADFMASRVASESAWLLRGMVALSRFYRRRASTVKRADELLELAGRFASELHARQYLPKDARFPGRTGGFRGRISLAETDEQQLTLPALQGRVHEEPSALLTACGLEGMAWVAAERKRRGTMAKKLKVGIRLATDFLVREQFDIINSYYFAVPDRAVGGVRLGLDNPRIHIDTMAFFIRGLLLAGEVLDR